MAEYPRPDWRRRDLDWTSLNGTWDFLYDDGDIGLDQQWQANGLPETVTYDVEAGKVSTDDSASGMKTVQKIMGAELSSSLISDKNHIRDSDNDAEQKSSKTNRKRTITVPFAFQTVASGINEQSAHEVLWYSRLISDPRSSTPPAGSRRESVLLRFGAVDYECSVWIDGQYIGGHRGGHVPFDLDITDALATGTKQADAEAQQHRLTIRVRDSPYDLTQPRGKQYWAAKPESIFYTPTSGIWQSVWLEVVPPVRLADSSHGTVLRSNDIASGEVHARIAIQGRRAGRSYSVQVDSSLGGVEVGQSDRVDLPGEKDVASLSIPMILSKEIREQLSKSVLDMAPPDKEEAWRDGLALWSPEYPTLYDLSIKLFDAGGELLDEVYTTTGMRSLDWERGDGHVHLNGRPYFQALVLDQGYWPKTGMTPPSQDALKRDIELSKQLGFNGCRKHQKVEDPVFLWYADKLGYLVWAEMANAYEFDEVYVDRFDQEWMEAVKRDISHPSVVAYTPVNESWGYTDLEHSTGQRDHIRSLYWMTKTFDPTRPINDNCGWEHVQTDLTTFHDYAEGSALRDTSSTLQNILAPKAGRPLFVDGIYSPDSQRLLDEGTKHKPGAPVLCTEFGGVNVKLEEGGGAGEKRKKGEKSEEWGYSTASNADDLLQRFEELIYGLVDGGLLCGFVYTQLADIEQEANGLLNPERKFKLPAEKVKAVLDEAKRRYCTGVAR